MAGVFGGIVQKRPEDQSQAPIGPSSNTFGAPSTFSAAVNTQAGDYDNIMKNYQDLLKNSQTANAANKSITFNAIAPTTTPYSASAGVTSSLSNLGDLSKSGGYSDQNISDMRARSISPIRSIYSSAQQGLDRQKSLQGGYSPNYTAATAKMAREMSEQIGQRTTDVEGALAEKQAAGRLAIAPTWSSAAQNENAARTAVEQNNAETTNKINQFNETMRQQVETHNAETQKQQQENMFRNVEGMRSLYGTTPALVNTFGNQVGQAANLGQGQQQINQQKKNANMNFASSFLN